MKGGLYKLTFDVRSQYSFAGNSLEQQKYYSWQLDLLTMRLDLNCFQMDYSCGNSPSKQPFSSTRVYLQIIHSISWLHFLVFKRRLPLSPIRAIIKKTVTLLSTMDQTDAVDTSDKGKPDFCTNCNSTKGGVDTMDQIAYTYTTKRKTKRWPMVMNMLDKGGIAADVGWNLKYPQWQTTSKYHRKIFLWSVAESLFLPHLERRSQFPRPRQKLHHSLLHLQVLLQMVLRPQRDVSDVTYAAVRKTGSANRQQWTRNVS